MRLVSVEEAAPILGFSRAGLYRVIREDKFPVPSALLKFGSQIRINLETVRAATQTQLQEAAVAAQK